MTSAALSGHSYGIAVIKSLGLERCNTLDPAIVTSLSRETKPQHLVSHVYTPKLLVCAHCIPVISCSHLTYTPYDARFVFVWADGAFRYPIFATLQHCNTPGRGGVGQLVKVTCASQHQYTRCSTNCLEACLILCKKYLLFAL